MIEAKKLKRKMSVVTETGFDCAVCGVQTVTYDGSFALECLNCHTPNPKQAWKDIIRHDLTVETVPPCPHHHASDSETPA